MVLFTNLVAGGDEVVLVVGAAGGRVARAAPSSARRACTVVVRTAGASREPEAAIAWMRRPEVWKALATVRQWSLRLGQDGVWKAAAVPPGRYVLQVVTRHGLEPGPGPLPVYGAEVMVPSGPMGETCDLGQVVLEAVGE